MVSFQRNKTRCAYRKACFSGSLGPATAQPTDSLQAQLAQKWANSKTYTLKLADLMPEDKYDFRPSPEEMTFREQLLHIADNMT